MCVRKCVQEGGQGWVRGYVCLLEQGAVRGVPERRGIDRGVNKKAREEYAEDRPDEREADGRFSPIFIIRKMLVTVHVIAKTSQSNSGNRR